MWDKIEGVSVLFLTQFALRVPRVVPRNLVMGEVRNPSRNLPLALFIGIPGTCVAYLLANVGYFAVLRVDQIVNFNLTTPEAVEGFATIFGEEAMGTVSYRIAWS